MPERYTPIDILNLRFQRQFRGYAREEVEEFMRRIASDLEAALTECALQREKTAAYERELSQYRALETTMRDALVMAQKAADETRTAAHLQAELKLTEADARIREMDARMQARVEVMSTRVEELRQEHLRLARDLRIRLSTQLAWVISEMEPDAAREPPSQPDSIPRAQIITASRDADPQAFTVVQQGEGG